MERVHLLFFFLVCVFIGSLLGRQSGWYWQDPLPQGNTLLGVSFNDANTGTAVGDYGTILRTLTSVALLQFSRDGV